METLEVTSSTLINKVTFEPSSNTLRVYFIRNAEAGVYYEFALVPRSVFAELERQEMGARSVPRDYPKGEKPYSVGIYYTDVVQVKYRGWRVAADGSRRPARRK